MMNPKPSLYLCPLLFCGLLQFACEVGIHSEEGEGTAPTISDLTLNPYEIPVGVDSAVDCTMLFTDPDGDVESITVELIDPDESHLAPITSDLSGLSGMTDGSILFTVTILTNTPGRFTIRIQLNDAAGNKSNPLEDYVDAT